MGEVLPIPRLGGVLRDARGAGRALRVSWHAEDGIVVLSLWDGAHCTGTVRLSAQDVPALIEALQLGLEPAPPIGPTGPVPVNGPTGPTLATGPTGPAPAAGRTGPARTASIAAVPDAGPAPGHPAPVEPGPDVLDGPGGTATG